MRQVWIYSKRAAPVTCGPRRAASQTSGIATHSTDPPTHPAVLAGQALYAASRLANSAISSSPFPLPAASLTSVKLALPVALAKPCGLPRGLANLAHRLSPPPCLFLLPLQCLFRWQ